MKPISRRDDEESQTRNFGPTDAFGTTGELRILIVDDEKMIRNLLRLSLQRMGYTVVTASDGYEALTRFQEQPCDLIMLDILMPGMDGFAVCVELRKLTDVPIVMLTALNRPDDIVHGLELGADNYITKPFTFKEVEARIRAILRRTAVKIETEPAQILEHGDVKLDSGLRAATVDGSLVELTRTEYDLLQRLMSNVDRPVSKNDLLQTVWGYEDTDTGSNIVELAIRRLRKKLEEDPSNPCRLVTVRGVGYKFCPKGTTRARVAPIAGGAPFHRRPQMVPRSSPLGVNVNVNGGLDGDDP